MRHGRKNIKLSYFTVYSLLKWNCRFTANRVWKFLFRYCSENWHTFQLKLSACNSAVPESRWRIFRLCAKNSGSFSRMASWCRSNSSPYSACRCGYSFHNTCNSAGALFMCWQHRLL